MSTTTENADLIVEIKSDRHWHIVLNRPDKYNAISLSMYKTMIEVLDRAGKDPHLTLLTIVGKGKYFSAGTDLSNPIRTLAGDIQLDSVIESGGETLLRFVDAIIDFPKILVAFVNGPSIGISCTILALFDAVFASSRSTFILPFTRTGQTAEACSSYLFPRLMGSIQAKQMLMFNRKIDAFQAEQRGLVSRVINDDSFDLETESIVREILLLPRETLLRNKRLINSLNKDKLHQINQREVEYLKESWSNDEFLRATMKFFERKAKSKL